MNMNRILGYIVAFAVFLICCLPWLARAEDPQDPGGLSGFVAAVEEEQAPELGSAKTMLQVFVGVWLSLYVFGMGWVSLQVTKLNEDESSE